MQGLINTAVAQKAREKLIEKYMPLGIKLMRENAGPHVISLLNDEERFDQLIYSTYQALPLPARLAIKHKSFAQYIKSHKDAVTEMLSFESLSTEEEEELIDGVSS